MEKTAQTRACSPVHGHHEGTCTRSRLPQQACAQGNRESQPCSTPSSPISVMMISAVCVTMHTVDQRHVYDIKNTWGKRNRLGQKRECKQACVRSFQSRIKTNLHHAKQDNLPWCSAIFIEELPEPWTRTCLDVEKFHNKISRKILNYTNFPIPLHPALRSAQREQGTPALLLSAQCWHPSSRTEELRRPRASSPFDQPLP